MCKYQHFKNKDQDKIEDSWSWISKHKAIMDHMMYNYFQYLNMSYIENHMVHMCLFMDGKLKVKHM